VSSDQDENEPVTDINVEIDASSLVAATMTPSRENVATLPAPPLPPDVEPKTMRIVRGQLEREGRALPAEYDDAPTGKLILSPSAPMEEESTALSIKSRWRKALQSLESEPPLEETKQRPAPSPLLPKSSRTLSMDLPEALPIELPLPPRVPTGAVAIPPGGPTGTAKIVSAAKASPVVAPLAAPAQPRAPRRRWGRTLVVALLVALIGAGYVRRTAVTAFVMKTMAPSASSRAN
jgi:hypothetical protein